MREKTNNGRKRNAPNPWGWIVAGAFMTTLLWGVYIWGAHRYFIRDAKLCEECGNGAWNVAGTFGDAFGALNALFSGLAFVGLLVTLWLQRHELQATRDEMHEQTTQFEKHVSVASFQILYEALPSYVGQEFEKRKCIFAEPGHSFERIEEINTITQTILDIVKQSSENSSDIARLAAVVYPPLVSFAGKYRLYSQWIDVYFCWSHMVDDVLTDVEKKEEFRQILSKRLNKKEQNILWMYLLPEGEVEGHSVKHPYFLHDVICFESLCSDWGNLTAEQQNKAYYLLYRLMKGANGGMTDAKAILELISSSLMQYRTLSD